MALTITNGWTEDEKRESRIQTLMHPDFGGYSRWMAERLVETPGGKMEADALAEIEEARNRRRRYTCEYGHTSCASDYPLGECEQ